MYNYPKIDLNDDQRRVVDKAVDWFYNSPEQVFQYIGAAGTGKSTVMLAILSELKLEQYEVAPMTYVGAAAMVMREKGIPNARTIHSYIFDVVDQDTPMIKSWLIEDAMKNNPRYKNPLMIPKKALYEAFNHFTKMPAAYLSEKFDIYADDGILFKRRKLSPSIKLICIDEGSMVPLRLRKEIQDANPTCKILVCGDTNQLPPVGGEEMGFFTTGQVERLTEIERQAAGSPIIYIANYILEHGALPDVGQYSSDTGIIEDWNWDVNMYSQYAADVMLAGTNRTRDAMNYAIRSQILHGDPNIYPLLGEKVICRKNNWGEERNGIALVNGLQGYILNYDNHQSFSYVNFITRGMNNVLFDHIPIDNVYLAASHAKRNELKHFTQYVPQFANPKRRVKVNKFEFAYCVTVHVAQGSQYNNGIFFEERFGPHDIITRFLYTGVTRFKQGCLLVKKTRAYY